MIFLDRRAELRTEHKALADMAAADDTVLIPLWRNRNLVKDNALVRLRRSDALIELGDELVFLGTAESGTCHFALALPGDEETPKHAVLADRGHFNDLRFAGPFMEAGDAELAAYARGVTHWHRHHGFCGKCGAETTSTDGGHVRICSGCGKRHFPRTDPAIMALIIDGDRCLLARQPKWPDKMFSILAGFVEPGESLEAAVQREVKEEVGLDVKPPNYIRSQGWPFPSSLMLGFSMHAASTTIALGDDELEEAHWFSKATIRAADEVFVPPKFSLAGQLIGLWLDGAIS